MPYRRRTPAISSTTSSGAVDDDDDVERLVVDHDAAGPPEAVGDAHRRLVVDEVERHVDGRVVAPARREVAQHDGGGPVGRLLGQGHGGRGERAGRR